MRIISRAEWDARPPRKTPVTVRPVDRTGFMVHYSGADKTQTVRSIQNDSLDNDGYNDIDYNMLVDTAGNAYEGRGWNVLGAHCTGGNEDNVGVCMIGLNDDVTDEALIALRDLYEEACLVFGKRLTMSWHSQLVNTSCPGDTLRGWVKAGMPYPEGHTPAPPSTPVAPPWPKQYFRYIKGKIVPYSQNVRKWQQRMKDRGWNISVDGGYGPQSAAVARAFQLEKGLVVDGVVGPVTWAATWTAPIS